MLTRSMSMLTLRVNMAPVSSKSCLTFIGGPNKTLRDATEPPNRESSVLRVSVQNAAGHQTGAYR